jgi:RecB family exonuclease
VSLPDDFVASATSLDVYAVCPRRFRHRYIDRLPAAGPDDDTAGQMQRGNLFHRLVLWHGLGIDTGPILESEDDPDLRAQWDAYLTFRRSLPDNGVTILHDQVLTASCGDYAVQARLDALAFWPDGDVTIFDWKTSANPDHARLKRSSQSKVYPYVAWNVLSRREDLALSDPSQIRLVYWFPQAPDNPLQIACSRQSIELAEHWLSDSLATIASDDSFEMTSDRSICKRCEYLAHCGVTAEDGDGWAFDEDYFILPEADEDLPFDVQPWH